MTLCFDEGTGNQTMTGGFLTDKQASYGWDIYIALVHNDSLFNLTLVRKCSVMSVYMQMNCLCP